MILFISFLYYRQPGNYSCSVSAQNIFGLLESSVEDEIVVQNPLNGDVRLALAKIPTVPFPPGNVSLDATLIIIEESILKESAIVNGYANDVDMTLLLGSEILKQLHGTHEIGEYPSLVVYSMGTSELPPGTTQKHAVMVECELW